MKSFLRSFSFGAILVCSIAPPAVAQYLPLAPYLSSADSPFEPVDFVYFHLENFEDFALNTPGVSALGSPFVSPNSPAGVPFVDSVDGDDGAIDGSGTDGASFYPDATSISFVFDPFALGGLPTHVGLVWTDVGIDLPGSVGVGSVFFEAFDGGGLSLGVLGPLVLGDGTPLSATAEDRFFGAVNSAGISQITMSMPNSVDWEVDHLQYGLMDAGSGSVVPEPAGVLLLATGLMGLLGAARVRRRDRRER